MQSSKEIVFKFTDYEEGGAKLGHDKNDPGSWSSGQAGVGVFFDSVHGVTAQDLIAYMKPKIATPADMANLSVATALAIWAPHYWAAMMCDALPIGIDLMVADFGYNAGTGASGRTLQKLLNMPETEIDGWIGNDTVNKYLPPALAAVSLSMFDTPPSENAVTKLQAALEFSNDDIDGAYGPMTASAMYAMPNGKLWMFCAHLADSHIANYKLDRDYEIYATDWTRRVWDSLTMALILAGAPASTNNTGFVMS